MPIDFFRAGKDALIVGDYEPSICSFLFRMKPECIKKVIRGNLMQIGCDESETSEGCEFGRRREAGEAVVDAEFACKGGEAVCKFFA